ncbi:MAG: hypothetical protein IPO16_14460 [Saprospiraceae bacterium]|nr:hypothetical protein [Saprospiraceae bacterium]
MKITTSLYLLFALLFIQVNSFFAQAQNNCFLETTPPTILTCPGDFTVAIGPGVCTPSVYWPLPTAFDACHSPIFGFTGFVSFPNWAQLSGGTGAQFTDFTPDSVRIKGTTSGAGTTNADLCFTANCNGSFTFNWAARKTGISLSFNGDHAFYVINGVPVQLTPNFGINASGNITVNLNLGDVFCFRVQSNNAGAQTFLTIRNFVYDNLTIQQIAGPTPESSPGAGNGTPIGAGTYPVSYQIEDCAGNVSFCNFNVTLTDSPPTITCPPSVNILLDTFDCNRVYCYNVDASDNCINTNIVLPIGYQFLGIHNGNTYYISPTGLPNQTNWLTANLIAAQLGGHLVTIEDAAENNFLNAAIPFVPGLFDNQYWIGLRYFPILGDYKWTTGEPLNYTKWGPLQPGLIDGDFVFYWDLVAGTWYDLPNDFFSRRHIIEFEEGLQIQLISGIPSGNPLPPGVTTNVYQVTDAVGQTATCSFTVNVIGSLSLSCKNVNVSLDEFCQVLITPQMLLTGDYNCYDVFDVTLSHYGKPVPNPIDSHYLGQHIIATVTDPTTGNSCWSDVLIEDKLAPTIICRADTVDCNIFERDFPLNYEGLDCSHYSVNTINEQVEHYDCNPLFLKAVYRDVLITDAGGNSSQCTDTIFVKRVTAADIVLPTLDFSNFSCTTKFLKDENGHPSPLVTRVPYHYQSDGSLNNIWPLNELLDCNILISYEDIDLGEINCVWKIMRIWTVREWWCGTEITKNSQQLIIIKDVEGPEITHAPYGFEATTGRRDCEARVLLPSIEAEDACHNKLRIDVAYPGGILLGQNGGYVNLPVGEDTIYYRVYDGCYNLTEHYIIIHVRDETEPVAVCDRNTVVALNQSGYNWVPAEIFDDGSFDECALHHFEVRRMDPNTCGTRGEDDWGPEVGFCCEDVGKTVMVGFKAIDHSGNEAICMVNVEVQDKEAPQISCPPNITVDCRFDIDFNNLDVFGKVVTEQADRDTIIIDPIYWHQIGGHPLDGLAKDNCPPTIVNTPDFSNINQCGLGYIIRYFNAEDLQGNVSNYCSQFITIINHDTFDINDIDFPDDYATSGICNPAELLPERLTYPYNKPVVNDDECSLIGYSYHDHVLSATLPGDPCFKIIRVWKVIDWCQRDIDGNVIIWTDTQYIKVTNLIDPIIKRVSQDTVICSYDVNCRPIPVIFSIEASDDCTDSTLMLYTYKIDLDSDGTIDIVRAGIGENVAQGVWPIGKHIVKWEVEDRCGNTAKASFILDLRNCKPPTAYCLNGLSTNLTPMDLDGDGIPDTAMDSVWAKDFDAGSYHNCGYYVSLSFSSDTNDKYIVYDCDSIGKRDVELWVTDVNGNTSYCRTFIIIQDNSGFCPPTIKNSDVNGLVSTEKADRVQNVTIELLNGGMQEVKTDIEGKYAFNQIANGQTMTVMPSKTDGWLNGVTTADIVKIQRHILGLEPLSSAYKMIAADVNKSKTITSKDVSDLRRLILGITNEISGNTSWRFVHQLYSFNELSNALNESFPESYQINPLNADMQLDFMQSRQEM